MNELKTFQIQYKIYICRQYATEGGSLNIALVVDGGPKAKAV